MSWSAHTHNNVFAGDGPMLWNSLPDAVYDATFIFIYLFIRHIHYYRQNVQLKTYN